MGLNLPLYKHWLIDSDMFLSLLLPLPEADRDPDAFPCHLSCSGGMSPHPPTNAGSWRGDVTVEGVGQKQRWWKARSCGTARAMLLVSKKHLTPWSANEGRFLERVGHGRCSGVTWAWSGPQNSFHPTDAAHQPSQASRWAPLPCPLCLPCFVSTRSRQGTAAGANTAHALV